jgi:hypothetical protein
MEEKLVCAKKISICLRKKFRILGLFGQLSRWTPFQDWTFTACIVVTFRPRPSFSFLKPPTKYRCPLHCMKLTNILSSRHNVYKTVSVWRTACVWLYDPGSHGRRLTRANNSFDELSSSRLLPCCYEIEARWPASMPVSSTISQIVDYYSAYFSFSSGRAIWLARQLQVNLIYAEIY